MELNDLFVSLILVNSLWVLIFRPSRSWVVVALGFIAALGTGYWFWRENFGWYLIGPWLLLMFAPMWLHSGTQHQIRQRHFATAEVFARLLFLLHPTKSVLSMLRMARIYRRLFRGDLAGSLELARQLHEPDKSLKDLALVIEHQSSGDWGSLRQTLNTKPYQGMGDPILLGARLQSATEVGDWSDALQCVNIIAEERFSAEQNVVLNLRAFALMGDLEAVHALLRASGRVIARESQEYWLAVAEQINGLDRFADVRLARWQSRGTLVSRKMMHWRRIHPALPSNDGNFRPQAAATMNTIRHTVLHEAKFAILSMGQRTWPIMTMLIMSVLVVNYCREIPDGAEDIDNLIRLGAMVVPPIGEPREWTRVLTSGLLHFGPVHLALNLIGLMFLGTIVERRWGAGRMLVQFAVCMICSGAILTPFAALMTRLEGWFPGTRFLVPQEAAAFVGASGGIMGLLGGVWGHLFVGWRQQASPLVRGQFRMVNLFIIMQSLCDVITPQVSMACHLFGLIAGMLGGVLVGMSFVRQGVQQESRDPLPTRAPLS